MSSFLANCTMSEDGTGLTNCLVVNEDALGVMSASIEETFMTHTHAINSVWLLVSAAFVFFMQSGFALLETGSIRKKNHTNILLKNITDITLGAIIFFFVGYGFAYGNHIDRSGDAVMTNKKGEEWDSSKQFIGDGLFAGEGFEREENT